MSVKRHAPQRRGRVCKLAEFRNYQNDHRTHRALGGDTPAEVAGNDPEPQISLNTFARQTHCRGFISFPWRLNCHFATDSLSGMMIKNAIVLLDEVNINLDQRGMSQYQAIVNAAMLRLNPVVLAAVTTVLGVIPLLQDVFWIGLAVTIMAGLAFGTLLTMILAPTLYATLYRIRSPATR